MVDPFTTPGATPEWSHSLLTLTPPSPSTPTAYPRPQISSSKPKNLSAAMPPHKHPKHPMAVVYPKVGRINKNIFAMTQRNWDLLLPEADARLKEMIAAAMQFRSLHDNPPENQDAGQFFRDLAEALRQVVVKEVWYKELAGPEQSQISLKPIIFWLHKREEDLVPLMEAFTTNHGALIAQLSIFESHGYTAFLASRLRFLAAYEHVYSTSPPTTLSNRKITHTESFFAKYDVAHIHHVKLLPEGSPKQAFFTLAIVNPKEWPTQSPHFNMPVASLEPKIHYQHSVMVSHGIALLAAIQAYGPNPISLTDPRITHIERTLDLCINAIEQYWELVQQLPKTGKFEATDNKHESFCQRWYVLENMGVCEIVRRDLIRARALDGNDTVMGGV